MTDEVISLPSAKANIQNIRDRWIIAKENALAHEDAISHKAKYRRILDWTTLISAGLTALLSALPPFLTSLDQDYKNLVNILALVMAILTAMSKTFEHIFCRIEDIRIHNDCVSGLKKDLEELNIRGAHVSEYLIGQRLLELNELQRFIRNLGSETDELIKDNPVRVTKGHKDEAINAFEGTSIQDALEKVTAMQENRAVDLQPGELPANASGIAAVQITRGN